MTVDTVDQMEDFISLFKGVELIHKRGTKKHYFNVALSFDIETSSIYLDKDLNSTDDTEGIKCSNMYIWQVAYNDSVIYGRYWKEFLTLVKKLHVKLQTSETRILPIYVHNLSYEFQYIYKMLPWDNVFAISERKPIYACTTFGIEFRCSYILSGYNLNTLANNLRNKTYSKMVGDLDYSLIRHNDTELTEKELGYCFNDVLIVTQYINEQMEDYGDVTRIPYTQTGKVREYVRNHCFKDKEYKYFMKDLKLTVIEYKQLQRCYSGGFTHSNAINTGCVIDNVSSYDFTSSYPYVMLSEKYPMSSGKLVHIDSMEQVLELLENYCCLFSIHLDNVTPRIMTENILQFSKCYNVKKAIVNNGRIVSCDSCELVVNEVDFFNLCNFYDFEHITISDFYVYEKGYLPKPIIECILKLYGDKTSLKGVEGKEKEYLNSKEMINSVYGMCVTNTMKENIIFNDGVWGVDKTFNLAESVEKYNNDRKRFLFYPWGVWVTSYARKNLLNGVLSVGSDYIYSDTDSIKLTNRENHIDYFNQYNEQVKTKLKAMCKHYDIDYKLCEPETIKGIKKPLGVWDYEGTYTRFKTLGAKRYMIEKDGKHEITIAGLSKNAVEYIEKESKESGIDIFTLFNNYMYIPDTATGKKTHTYVDTEYICYVKDYTGKVKKVMCKSGVHLSPCDFTMSIGDVYLDYLVKAKQTVDIK